ncbi:MAG: DNA-binding transcriptional MerR regulator [Oceanospirillaceae bacterium]|jgi:DNA-binding transcriptional MerR regulator
MPQAVLSPQELPGIPPKRYFTIGEVAQLCEVKTHVLRYWEQEFSQIKPVKRSNRRYYQRQDILIIRQVKSLLHEQGYTISGAKQWLSGDQGAQESDRYKQVIRQTINELEELLVSLKKTI